ncbi:hypothetical protein PBCVNW6652_224R [Paramecium bursaria Chlorella virus NW665.2]|nr:hypothetical protein PBCVNW6652_224R [Paramecium bursaria Chlorella virus NW665.2]
MSFALYRQKKYILQTLYEFFNMPRKCKTCNKFPSFGYPGMKPEYCLGCKKTDMINVLDDKCSCGSGKKHIYAYPGNKRECCSECKRPDMINVVSKVCSCGSGKSLVYAYPGDKQECCLVCKRPGMVNVVSKVCSCGSGKSLVYAYPGDKRECCSECKRPGMVNVVSKVCSCGSGKISIYAYPGNKRECCSDCKRPDMINVVDRRCPGYNGVPCPVATFIPKAQKYCAVCNPEKKPRKLDEEAFFEFLKDNEIIVSQREYRIDYKCINTSRSHSFIDGVIITSNIVICLEVDEEAHQYYEDICEEARIQDASAELRLAYPGHHIAWIRINPNILTKKGKRDRGKKGRMIRDQRHQEALDIINTLLSAPSDCLQYIGY